METQVEVHDEPALSGPSMTGLLSGIIKDGQDLLKQQLHLFQVELRNDLKRTTRASVALIIGGLLAGLGAFFLLVMLALALHQNWPNAISLWGGFGIVGGILLLVGKKKFDSFNPLPDQTLEGLKENIQWKTKN